MSSDGITGEEDGASRLVNPSISLVLRFVQLTSNIQELDTQYIVDYAAIIEPRHEKTNILVPTRSDTNQAVQPHKMARGLKIRI